MAWPAVAALGLQVVSSLFGANASSSAASKARRLSNKNALFIGAEGAEQKRRLAFGHQQTRSTTRTNIAASGFRSGKQSMGGSHRAYLRSMKNQQSRELDWITRSTKSRQDIARAGGQIISDQMKAQAFGQYAKAGQALFGIYDEVRYN